MRKLWLSLFFGMALGFSLASAQKPTGSSVARLDPALDAIVSANARLEMLKEDYFGNAEGPVWIKEGQSGYLVFSDIAANNIYKWTLDGKLSVFLERTGYSGKDPATLGREGYISGTSNGRMWVAVFGSNGIALDPQGRLVWCAQGDRAIIRQEKDGKRTVLADHFQGKRLNRPNDIAIKSDGAVYFTDGGSSYQTGIELDFNGLYLIKDGKIQVLEKDIGGDALAFSPDEKYFFTSGKGKIWRYDVQPYDTIANRREFSSQGCGALKTDQKGNVYCAGGGEARVAIISPDGKHLGSIITPQSPSNLNFGDPDGKTLYITSRLHLAKIRLNVSGFRTTSR